ncbi:hypothetical protein MANES_10G091832v8 [Manihot esculenta]|uniref:Uncharacterized protein n=1 Tax=Manihot esculenta TaxID=3983 RepID=A0ACB7H0Q0_MANES|nr:hypothetical protein MANES_10G091832v8 [Manihot esculenta]
MEYQYVVGGIIASVLGFLLLYRSRGMKKTKESRENMRDEVVKSSEQVVCRSENSISTDVIIVGAGIAGSALAYTLGKDGRRVHVIERDLTLPDRIIGELLQPGGYLKLIELGLEGESTKLSYPLLSLDEDVAGRSFHNGRFIQKMLEKAASLPNTWDNKGLQYKTKAGQELSACAPLTIVCDGCFSNLRPFLCNPKVDIPSCFVALILENCKLPYPNHGHVILAEPSPILFYRISSSEIRCLVDIPGQKLLSISNEEGRKGAPMEKDARGKLTHQRVEGDAEVVAAREPHAHDFLASELGGLASNGLAILLVNIRTMPNRSMSTAPYPTLGGLLLGNAFNMRHPLIGGGMTITLSDIVVLRNLLRPLHDLSGAHSLFNYFESFYTLHKTMASTINTLARALYKVFSASTDSAKNEMLLHFFVVAIYGINRLIVPFPSIPRIWIGARMIRVASGIIFPIIKVGVRQMFLPTTSPVQSVGSVPNRTEPIKPKTDMLKF